MEVSAHTASQSQASATPDPLEGFPTSGQPVSDTVLKEMLMSLRSSLHQDMLQTVQKCQAEVHSLGERVNQIEITLDSHASSFNAMVDAHANQSDDVSWIKDKLSDLEDRSRRNNLKVRGIPESIPALQLPQYVQELFTALLPAMSALELTVDRVHRIPKPSFLPDDVPRDVLLRLHFYKAKEAILASFRNPDQRPPKYASLQLLPDLSRHTLQKHRNLATITKALRNHHILHRWKYPATLSITHNGVTATVSTMEGLHILRQWGILSESYPSPIPVDPPSHMQADWQVVKRKKSDKKTAPLPDCS